MLVLLNEKKINRKKLMNEWGNEIVLVGIDSQVNVKKMVKIIANNPLTEAFSPTKLLKVWVEFHYQRILFSFRVCLFVAETSAGESYESNKIEGIDLDYLQQSLTKKKHHQRILYLCKCSLSGSHWQTGNSPGNKFHFRLCRKVSEQIKGF